MKTKELLLYTYLIAQLAAGPLACTASRNSLNNDPEVIRIIDVKAAKDEEYSQGFHRKEKIREYIEKASKALKQYGIEFRLTEIVDWDSNDNIKDLWATLQEGKREVPLGENDILILFTGQRYMVKKKDGRYGPANGIAEGLGYGNVFLITSEAFYQSIIHEWGHLIGADHDNHPFSVMNEEAGFVGKKLFYGKNRELVIKSKFRDYHKKVKPGYKPNMYWKRRRK